MVRDIETALPLEHLEVVQICSMVEGVDMTYNGSQFPCKVCQQSHRNSVHHNRNQFGYHVYQEDDSDTDVEHKQIPVYLCTCGEIFADYELLELHVQKQSATELTRKYGLIR